MGTENQSEFLREIAQAPLTRRNKLLPLPPICSCGIDRNSNVYTGFYSTDNGGSWVSMAA